MIRPLLILFIATCSAVQSFGFVFPDEVEKIRNKGLVSTSLWTVLPLNPRRETVSPDEVEKSRNEAISSMISSSVGLGSTSLWTVRPLNPRRETRSLNIKSIITNGIIQFTLNMDNAISGRNNTKHDEEQKNVIFSPLSLAGNMALMHLASRGVTFREIAKVLGLESYAQNRVQYEKVVAAFSQLIKMINLNGKNVQLQYANGIFAQRGYPIKTSFKNLSKNYKSDIINVDFQNEGGQAQKIVNDWVGRKTMGKISEILDSPPIPDTEVIFASALYFNGAWNQPFLNSRTKRVPFMIEPNQIVKVDMMVTLGEFLYHRNEDLGVKILGLPYKDSKVTMYVLLPSQPGARALKEFKSKLNSEILEQMIVNMQERDIRVLFPKMNLSSSLNLNEDLKSLGLESLFDPTKADFSNGFNSRNYKNENPGLYVSDVLHKVKININEKGTEAAAVTATLMSRMLPPTFEANRPFIFFIRDDVSKLILFWATINEPLPSY